MVDGVKQPHVVPFIPWSHQVPAVEKIDEILGWNDIGITKSRGEGASWIGILFCVHRWLFHPMSAIGMVSRTELAGDNPEDPDSLFWKIDWELTQLPRWMAGEKNTDWTRNLSKHTLRNVRNGSVITSYSTTGDVASGGRKKFFFVDELAKHPRPADAEAMASLEPVTDSLLIVSTPKGAEGAYYDVMHQANSMEKLTLAWQDNPTRNRGLYRMVDGKPVAEDPVNNPLPPEYNPPSEETLSLFSRLRANGFTLEKGQRSPWYDKRCDRPKMTPRFIAQEYDRDFGGSSYRIFPEEVVQMVEKSIRNPVHRGEISFNRETLAPIFDKREDGPVKIWCPLDSKGRPPEHTYIAGVDVSSGMGGAFTSNSAIVILDANTGEQVLEYATNIVRPQDFADECVALCKLFNDAYLAWEHMGPGTDFATRVLARRYPHCYRRTIRWKSTHTRKTKEYGVVHNREEDREALFGDCVHAIRYNGWQIRSEALRMEMPHYIRDAGKIVNIQAKSTDDDASMGKAHGDRVISLAVAFQAVPDRPVYRDTQEQKTPAPQYGTLSHRMKRWEDEGRVSGWDTRTTADLARK